MKAKAYNDFYIVEEVSCENNSLSPFGIMSYYVNVDLNKCDNGSPLSIGKITSVNKTGFQDFHPRYSVGDIILFDSTKSIYHSSENSMLIRNDSIVSLFDIESFTPIANSNEVVINVANSDSLYNLKDGFYGKITDISMGEYLSDCMNDIKVDDMILLVNPYNSYDVPNNEIFKKISTANGFYVISECYSIACKIEKDV